MDTVRELSQPGQALAPSAATATLNNPAWWIDGEPTPARDRLHRRLLEDARSRFPDVEQERQAIVLAGPPGAGKSTVLNDVLGDQRGKYLVIDADEFKRSLLLEARADGSYDQWLMPDAIREREAQGDKFFPLELASLVHEESSYLAKSLRADAIAAGDNIVLDTVLSNQDDAVALGARLNAAGYSIRVIDVEVPYELSAARIRERWERAYADALEGADSLGGRWVPSEYARPIFDTKHGRGVSQDVAAKLAENPAVIRYERHFTSMEEQQTATQEGRHAAPTKELDQERMKDGTLVDRRYLRRAAPTAQRRPGAQTDRGRGGAELS